MRSEPKRSLTALYTRLNRQFWGGGLPSPRGSARLLGGQPGTEELSSGACR